MCRRMSSMKVKLLSVLHGNPTNLSIAMLDMLQTNANLQGRHFGRTEISNKEAEFLGWGERDEM